MATLQIRKGLAGRKARYPAYAAIGLFFVFSIVGHDQSIHLAIQSGAADINAVSELFFPFLSLDMVRMIILGSMAGIVGLTIYAVMIRIAQRKAR